MSNKTNEHKGLLVVLSAPSGCGKTSITERLLKRNPDWVRSVSATTRAPRTDEKNGQDYFFLSQKEFEKEIAENKMLEYATVFGQLYGTPKGFVVEQISLGKVVILTIDVQGTQQIIKSWGKQASSPFSSIFILPPSIKALRERLAGRNTETSDEIERRIGIAQDEIKAATLYHHTVINQNLDQAVLDIESIILNDEKKRRKK